MRRLIARMAMKPATMTGASAAWTIPRTTARSGLRYQMATPPGISSSDDWRAKYTNAKTVKPIPRVLPALEQAERPVPLCNKCGEPLDAKGRCVSCGTTVAPARRPVKGRRTVAPPPDDADILNLNEHAAPTERMPIPKVKPRGLPKVKKPPKPTTGSKSDEIRLGEQEFWKLDE